MESLKKGRITRFLAVFLAALTIVTQMDLSLLTVQAAAKANPKSVTLNHTSYTLKKGKQLKLKATVKPANSKTKKVTWKSSKRAVATVSSKGVVKAKKNGKTTITATVKGTKLKAKCQIIVGTPVKKVAVSSAKTLTLTAGDTSKVKASVKPAKASNKKLSYNSNNTAVAEVSTKGVITAKAPGNAVITVMAKDGSKKKATIQVTVVAKNIPVTGITLSTSATSILVGASTTVQATVIPQNATNPAVSYVSSNPGVAKVDAIGKVTGVKTGKTVITAVAVSDAKIVSNAVTIEVKEPTVSVKEVKIQQSNGLTVSWNTEEPTVLTATVLPENATNPKVVWSSENETVAVVNPSTGVITAKKPGSTKITATADGKSDSITVTVPEVSVTAVDFEPDVVRIPIGGSTVLTPVFTPVWATDTKVTYQSSNTRAATVDELTGEVTAVAAGEARIIATTVNGGVTGVCNVIVIEPVTGITMEEALTYPAGMKVQLVASVVPENASEKAVTWSSGDETVAVIDEISGYLETKRAGTTVITATSVDGGYTAECTVTVTTPELENIYLGESLKALAPGESVTLNLFATPAAAELTEAQWNTSNPAVATVEDGVVSAVAKGEAQITVQVGTYQASCTIIVGNIARVSSFAELAATLAGDTVYDGIVLNTTESGDFTIAEGNFANTILIIDAKNATVANDAVFKSVQILAISSHTWIEQATGNVIDVIATDAHIVIGENSQAAIAIAPGVKNVAIDNNGTIGSMEVKADATIKIAGTNSKIIPVDVAAAGAKIQTTIPLEVAAQQIIALELLPGAETATSVTVPNGKVLPTIKGVGVIPVTMLDTNETTDVVAEYMEFDETADGMAASGVFTGIVKDALDMPMESVVIYTVPYTLAFDGNQIQSAIDAAERQDKCYITVTDADGKYTTPAVPYGNYVMIIKVAGMQTYFQTVTVTKEKVFNESIVLVEDTDATGDVEGVLKDAATGEPVAEGITLHIRQGANNVNGEPVQSVVTDATGGYRFTGLRSGNYCIQVEDTRDVEEPYVRITYNVVVLANTTMQSNMTISKYVEGDQIRFVLTWAPEDVENHTVPSDLDSHLVGPTGDLEDKFHVYYSDSSYYDTVETENEDGEIIYDSVRYADLDVDDTTYEGPETVTIYNKVDGLYHYYIYDFSNQSDEENTKLATSLASVKVYIGTRCVATYNVPYETGTLWDVCTYDARTNILTPVNTVYYHEGDSSDVGLTPLDIANKNLKQFITTWENLDRGEAVNAELAQKFADAKAQAKTADVDGVKEILSNLKAYINDLLDSTQLADITSDKIYSTYVESGSRPTEDSNGSYNSSSVNVYYVDETWMDDTFTVEIPEDATYEIQPSDISDGEYMLVVTSSRTGAVEKYYISSSEYVPSWEIHNVKANGSVVDYWVSDAEDVSEMYVWGSEEELAELEVQFREAVVETTVTIQSEGEYAATIVATAGKYSKTYLVRYMKVDTDATHTMYDFNVYGIDDSANGNCVYYISTRTSGRYIKILNVTGSAKVLGSDAVVTFEDGIEVTDCNIRAVEQSQWNYELTFTCDENEYVIYINYQQGYSHIPYEGYYSNTEGESTGFRQIVVQDVAGRESIILLGYEEELTAWDTISLYGRDDCSYVVREDEDGRYLDIAYEGQQAVSYPLYYSMYYDLDIYGTFTDGDNYIVGYDTNGTELTIYGENETLGEFTYEPYNHSDVVQVNYEAVESEEGIAGKLTLTAGEYLEKTYNVHYQQKMRTLEISGISSASNLLIRNGNEYGTTEDDEYVKVYCLKGYKELLGEDTVFELADSNNSYTKLEAGSYQQEIIAVENHALYNYKLVITYKGMEQVLYIRYEQDTEISILPDYGEYTLTYTNAFESIRLLETDGADTLRLTGYEEESEFEACWSTLTFYNYDHNNLVYEIVEGEDGTRQLQISLEDNVLAAYPVIYEKYVSFYLDSVTDGDNYIVNYLIETYGEGSYPPQYMKIAGENPVLGENPVFDFTYEQVETLSFEKLEEPVEYEGYTYEYEMLAGYKTQQQRFYIRYEQQIRSFGIQKICASNNLIDERISWEICYDEEGNRYQVGTIIGYTSEIGDVTDVVLTENSYGEPMDKSWYTYELVEATDTDICEYQLVVTFKGVERVFYLNYTQNQTLHIQPDTGEFTTEDGGTGYFYANSITWVDYEGTETLCIRSSIYTEEAVAAAWDNMILDSDYYDELSYRIRSDEENGTHEVDICIGDTVLETYPIIFEEDMDITYSDVTDENNFIISFWNNSDYDYELNAYVYYDTIVGMNETIGDTLQFVFGKEETETVLELLETPMEWNESVYTHKLTATYKTQKVERFICYKQCSILPVAATYLVDGEQYWAEADDIVLTEIDGVQTMQITGTVEEEVFEASTAWSTMVFSYGDYYLDYMVSPDEETGQQMLEITSQTDDSMKYPIVYKMAVAE